MWLACSPPTSKADNSKETLASAPVKRMGRTGA